MAIDVLYLQYKPELPSGINGDYWDMTMIRDLFNGEIWSWEKQYEFRSIDKFEDIQGDGAVIIMPARQQTEMVQRLNQDIAKFKWVVLMLTGDEESVFPIEQVDHPNIRFWVMSPRPERHTTDKYGHAIRKLGCGYTPGLREHMKAKGLPNKDLDFFFAGQINHSRRRKCIEALSGAENGVVKGSNGFAQGLPQEEYYNYLARTIVAPCPSGGYTPDTFRLFEALESGCFPIADEVTEVIKYDLGYWEWFFDGPIPFYPLVEYAGLRDYITKALSEWPKNGQQVFSWWQQQKRQIAYNLRNDIREVAGVDFNDDITVLMPTSVIADHPSTAMIEQTIRDVRTKLPHAEIIIMVDGLREQFKNREAAYNEYINRLLWKCNYEWKNVVPIVFDRPTHQVGMTRKALEMVKTPCILFVEHDCPLTPDKEFDYSFDELVKTIMSGEANIVRFLHESHILKEHEDLMIGEIERVNGVPLQRTMQYSQRPHLARTDFYRKMLEQNFSPDAYGMIEDHMYGKVLVDCKDNGLMGWYNWRIWCFMPDDENKKRSYTIDGRGTDSKYDDEFHY